MYRELKSEAPSSIPFLSFFIMYIHGNSHFAKQKINTVCSTSSDYSVP